MRVVTELSDADRDRLTISNTICLSQIDALKLNGHLVHKNQDTIGCDLVHAFNDLCVINAMVIAKTQSGKTGSICAFIQHMLECSDQNNLSASNIFIITGISSCAWKEQTRDRIPGEVHLFHRNNLNQFVEKLVSKRNVLIIIDEVHVASKLNQSVYLAFKNAGLLDRNVLYENDIKIVEYSATPDGTIYDLMKWGDSAIKIIGEPGEGYVGAVELYRSGRIFQQESLCDRDVFYQDTDNMRNAMDNIRELRQMILTRFPEPKYHIIRTNRGDDHVATMYNFSRVFDQQTHGFMTYSIENQLIDDMGNKLADINDRLSIRPTKHIFIFLKDMLRCAKTITKTYLGVMYDRITTNPDDSVTIQGFVGRMTGYDDNGTSICYTNIPSILKYEQIWESAFKDRNIRWRSKTTRFKKFGRDSAQFGQGGVLRGEKTLNDPNGFTNFPLICDAPNLDEIPIIPRSAYTPSLERFNTHREMKNFYVANLMRVFGGRGPNTRTPNDNGFFEAKIRSVKKVFSFAEIEQELYRGMAKDEYVVYPCYRDVNNANTLQWWLLHN